MASLKYILIACFLVFCSVLEGHSQSLSKKCHWLNNNCRKIVEVNKEISGVVDFRFNSIVILSNTKIYVPCNLIGKVILKGKKIKITCDIYESLPNEKLIGIPIYIKSIKSS